ncbi:MAG: glycosyltransferase [Phormidium sp.]
MAINSNLKRRLGYLSAAPRSSTRPEAGSSNRARILGCNKAFAELGWEVKNFIVGDRVPKTWVAEGSERAITKGGVRTLAADVMRLVMGSVNARRAWRELEGQVDWVYEYMCTLQSLGWIFKRHGIPWILETHRPLFYEADAEWKTVALKGLAKRMEIQAYRECDLIVCISETLKEILGRELGIPDEKMVVVPSSVDTSVFNPELYQPKRLFDGFTLGFIGVLYLWQGLDFLLETLREVRDEGLDISLAVVGGGQMREEWEAKAGELGLFPHVKFVGQVTPDLVPQYIAGFDIGYSGQIRMQIGTMYHSPLKIYEYMAMAKPVVASAFEDAQRTIRDGESGFLFQPGDRESLKVALRKAYESRHSLPEMGRKAREEIVANHSWKARMQTMIASVETILNKQ